MSTLKAPFVVQPESLAALLLEATRARLMAHVEIAPTGCWLWTRFVTEQGYGRFHLVNRNYPAHRAAYELFVGPVPEGLELDHVCRTPACVNPGHLEPVTHQENMRRSNSPSGVNARKTHCIRNHKLAGTNVFRDQHGHRQCRICHNARTLADYHRRRQRKQAARSAA